ncbi:MAG: polyprenyl synthetase family protein [Lachnospiraceae bacterium]|nr:polyprenyl synthetase family protein [Lachnospiraceae bacterium]
MDFKAEFDKARSEAEDIVLSYLPKEEGLQKTVMSSMNYSVNSGGKRLRPVLMMSVYKMFGGAPKNKTIRAFMAAQEYIHTYSLIHDDLPAMDNDELRRGRKTNHVVFGEAMAILAGDSLLNYAYETAIRSYAYGEVSGDTLIKALDILATKAGVYGMVGGQVVDVETEGKDNDYETLDFIYRLKTSALIESSMMIGAVLAGASKDEIKNIELIANKVGIAFQIQDDILDIEGDEATFGKPIGSDAKNGKVTMAGKLGTDKAHEAVASLTGEAVAILDSLGYNDEFVKELLLSLINRKK